MNDRSARMEESTDKFKVDAKAQKALENMRESLQQIREVETQEAMISQATIFFAYMPFQKIDLSKVPYKKEWFYKRCVAWFFLEPFAEYRPEQESVDPAPGKFTAYAMSASVVADEQKDYEGKNAKSFLDLVFEMIDADKKIKNKEAAFTDFPEYLQQNLNFVEEAKYFLQYTHNLMSMLALKELVDTDGLKERVAENKFKWKKHVLDSVRMPPTVKLYSAIDKIRLSDKIRVYLKKNDIEIKYSPVVANAYGRILSVLTDQKQIDKMELVVEKDKIDVKTENFFKLLQVVKRHQDHRNQ